MSSMSRLWFVGALAGLAAGIFTLLVLEVMAALGVPSAVYLAHALAGVAANHGTLSGAIRALTALGLAALGILLGLVFVAIVRDFHGLAATPGTLVIAGATFSGFLWWFLYAAAYAMSAPIAHYSPTPQLVAAIIYGAALGGFVSIGGVHETPCLE
jgi:hypothetical protein